MVSGFLLKLASEMGICTPSTEQKSYCFLKYVVKMEMKGEKSGMARNAEEVEECAGEVARDM